MTVSISQFWSLAQQSQLLTEEQCRTLRSDYESIRGPIHTYWKKTGYGLVLNVSIPPNTSATVHLPAARANEVNENGTPISRVKGVTVLGLQEGSLVIELESGGYMFFIKDRE